MSSPPSVDEDDPQVVATAKGVFDSNGGVLSSVETGVSIVIPKGAIRPGIRQEIYFKVCRDNTALPPLDKDKGTFISFCVVWWVIDGLIVKKQWCSIVSQAKRCCLHWWCADLMVSSSNTRWNSGYRIVRQWRQTAGPFPWNPPTQVPAMRLGVRPPRFRGHQHVVTSPCYYHCTDLCERHLNIQGIHKPRTLMNTTWTNPSDIITFDVILNQHLPLNLLLLQHPLISPKLSNKC